MGIQSMGKAFLTGAAIAFLYDMGKRFAPSIFV